MHSWHLAMRHGRRSGGHCRCSCQPMKAHSEMTSAFAPGQCISVITHLRYYSFLIWKNDKDSAELQKQHQNLWCTLFKIKRQMVFTSIPGNANFCFLTCLSWKRSVIHQGLLSYWVANLFHWDSSLLDGSSCLPIRTEIFGGWLIGWC